VSFSTPEIHVTMPAFSIWFCGMERRLNFCKAPKAFLRTELSDDWPLMMATSNGTMSGSSSKYLQNVLRRNEAAKFSNGGESVENVRATRCLRRNNVDEVNSLVHDGGVGMTEQRQKTAALPVALSQRAHDIKFDVLLQSAPADAKDRGHAESEPQRLKQQAAHHRLLCRQVSANLFEVQRYRLAAQKRGLRSLARDREVSRPGRLDVSGIAGVGGGIGSIAARSTGCVCLGHYPTRHSAAKVKIVCLCRR
jgi:hypothetical protein